MIELSPEEMIASKVIAETIPQEDDDEDMIELSPEEMIASKVIAETIPREDEGEDDIFEDDDSIIDLTEKISVIPEESPEIPLFEDKDNAELLSPDEEDVSDTEKQSEPESPEDDDFGLAAFDEDVEGEPPVDIEDLLNLDVRPEEDRADNFPDSEGAGDESPVDIEDLFNLDSKLDAADMPPDPEDADGEPPVDIEDLLKLDVGPEADADEAEIAEEDADAVAVAASHTEINAHEDSESNIDDFMDEESLGYKQQEEDFMDLLEISPDPKSDVANDLFDDDDDDTEDKESPEEPSEERDIAPAEPPPSELEEKLKELQDEPPVADDKTPDEFSIPYLPSALSPSNPEQLEAVLEQVIKKVFSEKEFSEKIETKLVEVIEKAVAKEMDRLKDVLFDDIADED
ncbi:MAG: hypothetical protein B6245_11700 [Desulfobacteraceae bacterium 4572_88]|nr:MAG: hypothetical protein B6245_11700 [Desulfobacteraceae bacterium 4572_88]